MDKSEIRKALSDLYAKRGDLTAEAVVKEATPVDSKLHGCFEWDNKKAGHKFRLIQARTLIRATPIQICGGRPEKLIHVPVSIEEDGRAGRYVSVHVIEADVDAYNRALNEALSDLDSALRRVAEIRRLKKGEDQSRFDAASEAINTAKLALVA